MLTHLGERVISGSATLQSPRRLGGKVETALLLLPVLGPYLRPHFERPNSAQYTHVGHGSVSRGPTCSHIRELGMEQCTVEYQ